MLVPGIPADSLVVRYRGAVQPQLLDVSFTTREDAALVAVRAWEMAMCDGIAAGAAGSDLFDPRVGGAKVVHEGLEPRRGQVRFEVAGVAPLFLRVLIDSLAHRVGALESLMVQGSLPPASDAFSAQTEDVLRWLAGARDYPARWGTVAFPVAEDETGGAVVRVKLDGPFEAKLREAIVALVLTWRGLVVAYPDPSGTYPGPLGDRFDKQWPCFGFSTREFRARFFEFVHAHDPSASLLVNMLCRLHAAAPIEECEIKI